MKEHVSLIGNEIAGLEGGCILDLSRESALRMKLILFSGLGAMCTSDSLVGFLMVVRERRENMRFYFVRGERKNKREKLEMHTSLLTEC